MKALTTKEYLSQAYLLDKRIMDKKEELIKLKSIVTNVGSSAIKENVQTSPNSDRIGDLVTSIIVLSDEITTQIGALYKLKYEIMLIIECIPHQELKRILELRYIKFKKWEEIAVEMQYSFKYVHKLHNKALNEIKLKLDTKITLNVN